MNSVRYASSSGSFNACRHPQIPMRLMLNGIRTRVTTSISSGSPTRYPTRSAARPNPLDMVRAITRFGCEATSGANDSA